MSAAAEEGGPDRPPRDDGPDPLGLRPRLLYRDGMILILDKPAGIAVHKGPKGGSVLEDGFEALRFGLPAAPALAHRLDRDTSGCLVLGRHRKALARMGTLFSEGRVEKTYWAVVIGGPAEEAGTISAPLRKRDVARGWHMVVDAANGQPSVTDWRVLGRSAGFTWLELKPHTGRTHQLRVHTAHLGCPILGDPIYGRAPANGPPLHLHARAVSIPWAKGKPPITATAPVPEHMLAALARCGFTAPA